MLWCADWFIYWANICFESFIRLEELLVCPSNRYLTCVCALKCLFLIEVLLGTSFTFMRTSIILRNCCFSKLLVSLFSSLSTSNIITCYTSWCWLQSIKISLLLFLLDDIIPFITILTVYWSFMLEELLFRGVKLSTQILCIFNHGGFRSEKFLCSSFSLFFILFVHYFVIWVNFCNELLFWGMLVTLLICFTSYSINLCIVVDGFTMFIRIIICSYICKLGLKLLCELLIFLFLFSFLSSWLNRTYIFKDF